jgi:hypothetical protein
MLRRVLRAKLREISIEISFCLFSAQYKVSGCLGCSRIGDKRREKLNLENNRKVEGITGQPSTL